ncbi:hypothetical protein F4859DRAFT_509759 [Xylaria cf. heliscus]|nr:hypothetical protein F4859DRAFT_509759 [Xylaria cf. heliscus]
MAKDAAVRSGLMPRKRRTSLSGFFSKILPSNRAEQGGTVRIQDMTGETDSAYEDLGMNPNELTGWNLAQERLPRRHPSGATAQSQHPRGQSWGMQRGRTRLRDDIGELLHSPQRTPSFGHARPPEPPGRGPPLHAEHENLQVPREEILNTLRAKEDSRRHRQSLKESGDWLGVQGADPYSGEFAVLTPISTLSSEITPPQTRKRLAELSRKQKFAKLAYDRAKYEEEIEREKAILQKGRSKLEKIESAKEELRQQREFPTWIQHKRRWSSAAEPDLSPIPQSLKSSRAGNDSDEIAVVPIRNFSRPSKSGSGASVMGQSKPVAVFNNSENTEPSKHDHHRSPSTETIVHNSIPNTELPSNSTRTSKMLYPSIFSAVDDSPTQDQNSEKHFLWRRRRRMTDPGKLVRRSNTLMTHPSAGKTEESLASASSVEPPPPIPRRESRDHFSDLLIPDSHLHLVPYPERMIKMQDLLDPIKQEPFLIKSTMPTQGSHSEARNNSALKVATNLFDCREPQINTQWNVLGANEATAISFPSRLKGNMKPTPIYRRLIPLRSSSAQARLGQSQALQIQNHDNSQTQNHIETDLPGHTPATRNLRKSVTQEGTRTDYTNGHMAESYERVPGGFVSTPTIIITGFDHEPQLLLEGTQSHVETWKPEEGITAISDELPTMPSRQSYERELHNTLTTDEEREMTTYSHPITPRRSSPSFVLAHETPETDTALTGLAIWDRGPTPPVRHHETAQDQNTQSKASKTNEGGVPCHLRASRARLAHQRRASSKHREAMIQDAARIAIQRSRAKEIITTKTHTPDRTPSPLVQDALETTPAIPSAKSNSGGSVIEHDLSFDNIDFLIKQDTKKRHLKDSTGHKKDWEDGTCKENTKPGTLVIVVSFVITISMIVLGLACAAWSVAKPAFDTRSQVWKRKRRGENTWEDHSVFATAGMLLVVGALVVAAVVQVVLWIVFHL